MLFFRVNAAALIRMSGAIWLTMAIPTACADDSVSFKRQTAQQRDTTVDYTINIQGEISTPSSNGVQKFPLKSNGRFEFTQRQFASDDSGPFSLSAIRFVRLAETETTVGTNHTTSVNLPLSQRMDSEG